MITTRGRYALRVMVDLAEHQEEGYIRLKDIAVRQDISQKYLEIIVKDLVKGKLLVGLSGKGGGYQLCREPQAYSIGEILETMEGTLASVACLAPNAEPCKRAEKCSTLPLWKEYDELIHSFFFEKKLSDLVKKPLVDKEASDEIS